MIDESSKSVRFDPKTTGGLSCFNFILRVEANTNLTLLEQGNLIDLLVK